MPERLTLPIHGPEHVPGGPDPIPYGHAIYQIEVFEPDVPIEVGDDAFDWEVPEDLDGAILVKVEGYTAEPAGSEVAVQLRKLAGGDVLTTPIYIDAGNRNSKDSATQPEVADDTGGVGPNRGTIVAWGDHFRVDVDEGAGTLGLGIVAYFYPPKLLQLAIRAEKGDPGGVTSWEGDWSGSTTYVTNQSVVNNGTSYVARVDNPTTEPGVDPGWEDEWQVLAERQLYTALTIHDFNSGREIDIGQKAIIPFEFPCQIVGWRLLADIAGDLELDLLLDDYASYPPTSADSIVASAPPFLSAQSKNLDTALVGWSTSVADGDVLIVEVVSASSITQFSLTLKLRRF